MHLLCTVKRRWSHFWISELRRVFDDEAKNPRLIQTIAKRTDAEREYKHCLEINPNHTLSHYHYAMYLSELGRFSEAIAEAKEAQVRDPLSAPANACLAWTLWAAGESEKALHQALVATELDPSSMFATVTAAIAYEQNGMYRASIAEFEHGIQTNGCSIILGFQGHAFACSGDKENA